MRSTRFRFVQFTLSHQSLTNQNILFLFFIYVNYIHPSKPNILFPLQTHLISNSYLLHTWSWKMPLPLFLFYPVIICLPMQLFTTFQSYLKRLRYNWKSIPLWNFKHFSRYSYVYAFFTYNIIIISRWHYILFFGLG